MFVLNKQAIKLYYKIRHRRGHGIHSPFVYHFIVNVIENKLPFYAYEDIKQHIEVHTQRKHKQKRENKLIFKTINYFNLKDILLIGTKNGINTLYASASSSRINCLCVEERDTYRESSSTLLYSWNRNINFDSRLPEEKLFDCIIVDFKLISEPEKTMEYVLNHIHEKSVVIMNNIRTNPGINSLSLKARKDDRVRISLDLYKISIFFFDKKYHKRNYILSF